MIVYFWGNHICSICSEVTDKALHQPALPAMMEGSHHIDVKMGMMLMMMVVVVMMMGTMTIVVMVVAVCDVQTLKVKIWSPIFLYSIFCELGGGL